jgi:hypothetical protein
MEESELPQGKQDFTGQAEKGIEITCKIKGRYGESIK